MANVLPLDAQKKLWRMYRARFIIAFSILMCGLAVLCGLLMIPSYFALRIAAVPVSSEAVMRAESAAEDTMAVARAQALVRILQPLLSATSSPAHIITSVLYERPKGVLVRHVTYTGGQGQLLISGSAARDAINVYRDTLLKHPSFTSVSIPVAALVGNEGGNFSITLTGSI